jgi:hypothetical protein
VTTSVLEHARGQRLARLAHVAILDVRVRSNPSKCA